MNNHTTHTPQDPIGSMNQQAIEQLKPLLANPNPSAVINQPIPQLLAEAIKVRNYQSLFPGYDYGTDVTVSTLDLTNAINTRNEIMHHKVGTSHSLVTLDQVDNAISSGILSGLKQHGYEHSGSHQSQYAGYRLANQLEGRGK